MPLAIETPILSRVRAFLPRAFGGLARPRRELRASFALIATLSGAGSLRAAILRALGYTPTVSWLTSGRWR
jgi:hypothetical protein